MSQRDNPQNYNNFDMQTDTSPEKSSPQKKFPHSPQKYLSSTAFLNQTSEVEGDIYITSVNALYFNIVRSILSVLISLLLGFIPLIMTRWSIKMRRFLFYDVLNKDQMSKASHFLIQYSDEQMEIVEVIKLQPQAFTIFSKYVAFGFQARKIMYIYNQETNDFQALETTIFKELTIERIFDFYQIPFNQNKIDNQIKGLTLEDVKNRQKIFGKSIIDIEYKNIILYLIEEMTAPLYFIQFIAVIIWILQEYYIFGGLILGVSVLLQVINYFFYRSSMLKLKDKAHTIQQVQVFRDSNQQNIELQTIPENNINNHNAYLISKQQMTTTSDNLVPGDLILLEDNMTVPCDCILLTGEVFINEMTLTGECVPVPKYELDVSDQYYIMDQKLNTKSLIFEGTIVIKTKPTNRIEKKCIALVQRTSYSTFKGQIFRSLVFIKSQMPIFQTTGMAFIGILAIVGLIACVVVVWQFIDTGISPYAIVLKMGHNILHLAPPALPIMTASCLTASLSRLRLKNIFGVSPQAILLAGKVTTCCFDKTGTLTETHLDFSEFLISKDGKFNEPVKVKEIDNRNELTHKLFATCHSITSNSKGETFGDPLDLKMFEASGYVLKENSNQNVVAEQGNTKLEIVYSYPFSSNDQCMSVVIKDSTFDENQCYVFTKGSPEKLCSISKPGTIPKNFDHILRQFTMLGLRVLAMGYKVVPLKDYQNMKRQQIESQLDFMGLMVFKNFLKHDTADVLTRLRNANYKVKMISGDNPLTCVQAGKQAAIVPEDSKFIIIELTEDLKITLSEIQDEQLSLVDSYNLLSNDITVEDWIKNAKCFENKEIVMHGAVLEHLFLRSDDEEILKLIQRTALFGRCRPEHKAMVIKSLKKLGIVCAMVGDGANDCPAIKAADLGISFSSADGSISAPFSALSPSIDCIIKILMEGKCTLQNSIDNVKYYSTTGMYKVLINLIMVFEHCWMSQMQNVFASYIAGTQVFNILFGLSSPVDEITLLYPDDNLLAPLYIGSYIVHSFIGCLGIVIIYIVLLNSNFYLVAPIKDGKLCDKAMVNTIMMNISYILSITTLFAMYVSKPFRRPLFRNYVLVPLLIGKLIYCIIIIIEPTYAMPDIKEVDYDMWFAAVVLGIWIIVFILQYISDYLTLQKHIRDQSKELAAKQLM